MKVLVVDDEPLATERLQLLLARVDGVDLVGTAADGEDGPGEPGCAGAARGRPAQAARTRLAAARAERQQTSFIRAVFRVGWSDRSFHAPILAHNATNLLIIAFAATRS